MMDNNNIEDEKGIITFKQFLSYFTVHERKEGC